MPTPGVLRQCAAQARRDAVDYRRWAHETADPVKKRLYERWADDREDSAVWYENYASRGEIVVEYTRIEPMREAAE
jgi:hypothetical protein